MKLSRLFLVLTLAIMALLGTIGSAAADDMERYFVANLRGEEEVPSRETIAHGQARLELNEAGNALTYEVEIVDIVNLVAGHIHLGRRGENGPVVVQLYGPVAPGGGGLRDDVHARGTITEANFVGPLAGQPFSSLLTAMRGDNAYVNFHTDDGVAPADTGPGDFPGGEIRNQVEQGRGNHDMHDMHDEDEDEDEDD